MFIRQYYLDCLAHASYMIADPETRDAVVIDPQRDIELYLEDARKQGFNIRHVVLTHFHADFLAGHLELRDRAGARIHLGRRARAEFDFGALGEGDELRLGPTVTLRALETPGHTPEGISLLVFDGATSTEKPHAVLTGDTLFIGDVGRPDLMASVGLTAEELAGMLYDSLHDKLLPLPDQTLVYPAHGAGSACGQSLSKETVSTMGEQRRVNYALQPMSRDEFIEIVTAERPAPPAYFTYDATLNRQERQTLDHYLETALRPLAVEQVASQANQGAQIVDVRDANAYAGNHLLGSVNIGLDGKFATWAGSLLDADRPIVIVAEPGREEEAVVRLGRIGFDRVVGFLENGMHRMEAWPDLVGRVTRVSAAELAETLEAPEVLFLLDVRTEREFASGEVPGAVNVPLPELASRIDELPRDREIVIYCASGYRSSSAASMLRRDGFARLRDLAGGIAAWEKASQSSPVAA